MTSTNLPHVSASRKESARLSVKSELSNKTLLPNLKTATVTESSVPKSRVESWNWFEHHPIEKNTPVPSIGHFKHNNSTEDDKNIAFIDNLFDYNREVEPRNNIQITTLKNQENNYKLQFKPKRAFDLVKTKKHETEYPLALTYRFLYLIKADKWNEASRVCRKIITLQPTQRIYREYLVLLNSFVIMKQKFINMSNTRVYESRMRRNQPKNKRGKQIAGQATNKADSPKPNLSIEPRASSVIAALLERQSGLLHERFGSQDTLEANHDNEHKSDLEIIIDEFYALK